MPKWPMAMNHAREHLGMPSPNRLSSITIDFTYRARKADRDEC
jgi:hypothetical protein